MKINQYCSVCKQHLDMDVVPTEDGGDDGVIWLRCPECKGFLPKFSGESAASTAVADPTDAEPSTAEPAVAGSIVPAQPVPPQPRRDTAATPDADDDTDDDADDDVADDAPAAAPAEPIAEYAARLAAADVSMARPYRPSDAYTVGDVIHHLAWDDCGLVVANESLPGGRKAVKVYFESVGVAHLIERTTDGY